MSKPVLYLSRYQAKKHGAARSTKIDEKYASVHDFKDGGGVRIYCDNDAWEPLCTHVKRKES
jgi:hypothetical protein